MTTEKKYTFSLEQHREITQGQGGTSGLAEVTGIGSQEATETPRDIGVSRVERQTGCAHGQQNTRHREGCGTTEEATAVFGREKITGHSHDA